MLGGLLAQRQAALRWVMAAGHSQLSVSSMRADDILSTYCASEEGFLEKPTDSLLERNCGEQLPPAKLHFQTRENPVIADWV